MRMTASDQRFGAVIGGIPRKSVGERRPQSFSPAVLLSRQDFEHLRALALSPSTEAPRPRADPVPTTSASAPATGNARSSSARAGPPAVPKRAKSASENRFAAPQGGEVFQGRPSAAIAKAGAKAKQAPRPQPGAVRRVQQAPFALEAQSKAVAGPKLQAVSSARRGSDGPPGPQLGLGVCGHDMRKATSLPQQPQAVQQLGKAEQSSPSWRQMAPLNGLQVGGLAVQAAPSGAGDTPTLDAEALQELLEHWSSGSETDGSDREDNGADSTGEVFDCRKFRYQRTKDATVKAAAGYGAAQAKRRAVRNATAAPETPSRQGRRGESPTRGCTTGWEPDPPSPRWGEVDPLHGRAESRLGECSSEPIEIEGAFRVADILWKFYGLPGSVADAVSVKCNVIAIHEAAWLDPQRKHSSYGEPPMLWVRGDRTATGGLRVYDFKGDRGTIQEFENDFLVRGVEDDSTIRMRRRDQGMLCMPFLPLPVRREEPADDDEDDEAPPVAPAPKLVARRRSTEFSAVPSLGAGGARIGGGAAAARPSTSDSRPNSSQKRPAGTVF